MQKYKTLRSTIYYNIRNYKNIIIYKLILFLYRYTDKYLFPSINVSHKIDWWWYTWIKYFCISNQPNAVNQYLYKNY